MAKPSTPANRLRRRLIGVIVGLAFLAGLVVMALPWGLSTRPGRLWLTRWANRLLSPGRLDLSAIRFSWFGTTRITGLVLRDARGDRVVVSPFATLDRNLYQLLFERPRLGTLRLDGAVIDAERAPDGSVDLYETLRPVIGLNPATALTIVVDDGRLTFRGEGLANPITAEHADINLAIVPVPNPLTWRVRLANGTAGRERETLEAEGRVNRTSATSGNKPGLEIRVSCREWPVALADGARRWTASGRLGGVARAVRDSGRWKLSGDVLVLEAEAAVARLSGDRLRAGHVRAGWDVSETAGGWSVRRFTAEAGGAIADLAPKRLRGRWSAQASAQSGGDGVQLSGKLDVSDLAWGPAPPDGDASGESASLTLRAGVPTGGGRVDLSELALTSRYVSAKAAGLVDDAGGRRVAELRGTLSPDWDEINKWLRANVEPGATVAGHARPIRLRAALGDDPAGTLDGELGIALEAANLYGLHVGPAELVVRSREGKLAVDPIDTTVNEGRLHLVPELRRGDEEGPALVLGTRSTLTDSAVNDEVSQRVLSFVAPVLDRATRVHGRVSATVEKAVFPIGDRDGRGPTVEGSVVFQDVEFMPGPLSEGLVSLVGRGDRPLLRLDRPVALRIADRRVYQRGLEVPVGKLTRIGLDGWVGFDRELNLTASIPVLPAMLADRPLLSAVAADAKVRVPIRGTLQKPEIDREAFRTGMKDLGRSLLENGLTRGATELIDRFMRGRDPDAPPPPPRLTPEQRRERREERRAERQRRRDRSP